MNERKIAFWALVFTFLGWAGIKPDYFKSFFASFWELVKSVFISIWSALTFSINIPVSLILLSFSLFFLLGLYVAGKYITQHIESDTDEKSSTENSKPLSKLNKRQRVILLDIYDHTGHYKDFTPVMRHLKIDSHMLNQALDQLIELGYVTTTGTYSHRYPVLTRKGRDEVISFMEYNQNLSS